MESRIFFVSLYSENDIKNIPSETTRADKKFIAKATSRVLKNEVNIFPSIKYVGYPVG